ncbi:ABC transporter substrate-binding protein [Hymenobacter properus]|uniref:ABC transporter substrate-binding protein n=1 Tax=Hymenobacter properus TaxID=2791026 RepID=A0A931FHU8_9BACT|nr:ABC transporter substrate-binding protein [Hymenobacter properus]MBF9141417.1 ABC transporter substrate-binding protein [Hymenobacter properus]MBR7720226.1 ABC transporter substrate-binding protein [Microvirga sp. SRT04]
MLLQGCTAKRRAAGSVQIRWAHDPENLDPMAMANQTAIDAINLLNCSLLQVDFATNQFAPALAEALPTVQLLGDSLMRLHYTLRPEAAWDNGRPVLATDVAFTLKLMFCPGLPNTGPSSQYRFIRDILVDPHYPRRFTLVCTSQSVENVQASGDFFILPEAALDPKGELRAFSLAALQRHVAAAPSPAVLQALARRYAAASPGQTPARLPGCGPYQLVKWEKDRYLSFQRKAHWWADRVRSRPLALQARPARLEYAIIPDPATASLALQRGDIDVFPQMPPREFKRLRQTPAARAALNFYTTASYDVVTAGFNTRHPALSDALTRQALGRCFDAAGLLQGSELGEGQRTVGLISPADRLNYNNKLVLLPFDLAGAVALLRQAGWQRGTSVAAGWQRLSAQGPQQLRLTMRYRTDEPLFATVALQFQAAAASIGVPVSLQPTEAGAFTVALHNGEFDVYVRALRGNPFMFNFTSILHSQAIGAGNTTGFGTPESDRLIEAIAAASTVPHRAQLLHRFQALMQQQMPLVPLFFRSNHLVAQKRLTSLHPTSLKPGFAAMAIGEAVPSTSP